MQTKQLFVVRSTSRRGRWRCLLCIQRRDKTIFYLLYLCVICTSFSSFFLPEHGAEHCCRNQHNTTQHHLRGSSATCTRLHTANIFIVTGATCAAGALVIDFHLLQHLGRRAVLAQCLPGLVCVLCWIFVFFLAVCALFCTFVCRKKSCWTLDAGDVDVFYVTILATRTCDADCCADLPVANNTHAIFEERSLVAWFARGTASPNLVLVLPIRTFHARRIGTALYAGSTATCAFESARRVGLVCIDRTTLSVFTHADGAAVTSHGRRCVCIKLDWHSPRVSVANFCKVRCDTAGRFIGEVNLIDYRVGGLRLTVPFGGRSLAFSGSGDGCRAGAAGLLVPVGRRRRRAGKRRKKG